MNEYPELYNESYVLYDRVMNPLAAQLERKVRRGRGTRRGRPSTSSSTLDQPSSSHLNDDDDDGNDEGTSRASTPSPIRYVNSLANQVPLLFKLGLISESFGFFSLWSNSNKEPKLGRSYSEELGTVDGVGTRVCCRCIMREVGGGGRVVADNRGSPAKVVTGTSTSEVDLVFRLNKESIPVSGLGLSMLEREWLDEHLERESKTYSRETCI
ncbi:hypothetical protein Tco_0271839 [Tanacetum coccineum]